MNTSFKPLKQSRFKSGTLFLGLLFLGLLSFEVFNFSTTQYAFADILGDLSFAGIRWATLLAIAFCGIDFAGIARLFTPETGKDEPAEVWYLFGAWVLAAAMNATLTWWGVAVAIQTHSSVSSSVVGQSTFVNVVPVFIAILVWVIRILLIGTFSLKADHYFNGLNKTQAPVQNKPQPTQTNMSVKPNTSYQPLNRPGDKPQPSYNRPMPGGLAASSNSGQKRKVDEADLPDWLK